MVDGTLHFENWEIILGIIVVIILITAIILWLCRKLHSFHMVIPLTSDSPLPGVKAGAEYGGVEGMEEVKERRCIVAEDR
jgi:hypothetical protein